MHVVVVANGELPSGHEAAVHRAITNADLVIAADGGLAHCVALGLWPSQLVGDLDSVDRDLVERGRSIGMTVVEYPADKDATDLELALDAAVAAGANQITLITPFGGRLDHELATISLLAGKRWSENPLRATDGRRELIVIRSRASLDRSIGDSVSLIPWAGDVTGVTTTGLQWPLANATLPLGTTRGVSNVVTETEASVSIAAGVLLAVTDLVEHG